MSKPEYVESWLNNAGNKRRWSGSQVRLTRPELAIYRTEHFRPLLNSLFLNSFFQRRPSKPSILARAFRLRRTRTSNQKQSLASATRSK